MTLQIDSPSTTVTIASDFEDLPFGVLLGSWAAAREMTAYAPAESGAGVEPVEAGEGANEIIIFGAQAGLRNKISAHRARRRSKPSLSTARAGNSSAARAPGPEWSHGIRSGAMGYPPDCAADHRCEWLQKRRES
jgi:hypothetical protein